MYTEEKLRRVNKIIKDMVFEFEGKVDIDLLVSLEYQFQITGVKKMISVGEYYDYLVVDITIVNGDKRFDILCKIVSKYVSNDYRLLMGLNYSISNELVYFFDGSQPRIHIPKGSVKLSDEYQEKIDDMDITKPEN